MSEAQRLFESAKERETRGDILGCALLHYAALELSGAVEELPAWQQTPEMYINAVLLAHDRGEIDWTPALRPPDKRVSRDG